MAELDASIPLKAGQGVPPPVNPLQTIGQFAGIQNQLNQAKLFPEILAQQKQKTLNEQRSSAFGLLAPMLALPPEQWTHQMVTDLAAKGEGLGYVTHPILAHLASAPAADGAPLYAALRPLIATQMLGSGESRLSAVTPQTHFLDVGGQIKPLTVGAAGGLSPGIPTESAPGFEKGYSPEQGLDMKQVPATQADVDASGGKIQLGQSIWKRTTTLVGPNVNPGGTRIPSGNLGPGTYAPPQKPLTQLGPPYRPPGAPGVNPNAPVQTPPGTAAPPVPGARLMKGPGGSFWVTPDKVQVFQQNGYQ